MDTTGCYYKLIVLQVDTLETTIYTEKHYVTLTDPKQAVTIYKEQGLVTILLRMWQNGMDIAV